MTFLFQKVKSQNSWFRFTERFHHRIQRKKAVFVMHSHKILTGFYILQVFRFMILIADLLSILNLTTESLPGPTFIFTVQQKFSNRKQFSLVVTILHYTTLQSVSGQLPQSKIAPRTIASWMIAPRQLPQRQIIAP